MQDSTSMARPMTPAAITARAQVLAHEHRLMRAELVDFGRRAGLSQGEVAERMGVSQQAVSKFEAYDADPKLSTLRRYANAVGALLGHRVERDHGQSEALAGDACARVIARGNAGSADQP